MTGLAGDTSHHNQPERCWTESGEHYFAKESDGVWVCQICGDARQLGKRAAVAGRDAAGGDHA
jgi:hypothetical protein